jgi:hypothetical protein
MMQTTKKSALPLLSSGDSLVLFGRNKESWHRVTQAVAVWFAAGGKISLLFLKFPFPQARTSWRAFPA